MLCNLLTAVTVLCPHPNTYSPSLNHRLIPLAHRKRDRVKANTITQESTSPERGDILWHRVQTLCCIMSPPSGLTVANTIMGNAYCSHLIFVCRLEVKMQGDLKTLPAGIYIVNGKKVIVK